MRPVNRLLAAGRIDISHTQTAFEHRHDPTVRGVPRGGRRPACRRGPPAQAVFDLPWARLCTPIGFPIGSMIS
jgi:hypothetical protein